MPLFARRRSSWPSLSVVTMVMLLMSLPFGGCAEDADENISGCSKTSPSEDLSSWCQEAGFVKDVLKCSACDKLAGALSKGTTPEGQPPQGQPNDEEEEELVRDCRRCCSEDEDGKDGPKYVRARLEMDRMFLQFFPEMREIVEHKGIKQLTDDDLLKIKFRSGVRPVLQLFAEGQQTPGEVLSVSQWRAEAVIDFLRDNLMIQPPPQQPHAAAEESGGEAATARE